MILVLLALEHNRLFQDQFIQETERGSIAVVEAFVFLVDEDDVGRVSRYVEPKDV